MENVDSKSKQVVVLWTSELVDSLQQVLNELGDFNVLLVNDDWQSIPASFNGHTVMPLELTAATLLSILQSVEGPTLSQVL